MTSPGSPGSPTLPGTRRLRTLTALHGGLGFGASEITERALEVARRSQAQHDLKKKVTARKPLDQPMPAQQSQPTSENVSIAHSSSQTQAKGRAAMISVIEEINPLREVSDDPRADIGGVRKTSGVSLAGGAASVARNAKSVRARVTGEVGRARAIVALGLDFVVAACVFVLSAVLSYALSSSPVGAWLGARCAGAITKLAEWVPQLSPATSAHAVWAAFGVQALALAAAALFLCQLICVSFFRSTLGRFVVGIELAEGQRGARCRVSMALAEVLTAGGLFSLPFVVVTPKRVPLFPWIKLRREA